VRCDQRAHPEAENHDEGGDQAGEPAPLEGPDVARVGARAAHRVDSVAPGLAPTRRRGLTGLMVDERNGHLDRLGPRSPRP
jgi:hypothetical protein